jgi:hypothetical protein
MTTPAPHLATHAAATGHQRFCDQRRQRAPPDPEPNQLGGSDELRMTSQELSDGLIQHEPPLMDGWPQAAF